MSKEVSKLTARDLIGLLAAKHAADVFVTECKVGQTSKGSPRLDAWVMSRSWATPRVVGYEVKVSRSDFLADQKWPSYLPYCNELYFCCQPGVIQTAEVPEECGLVLTTKSGTRLLTAKKAPYRPGPSDDGAYRYVLMWRSKITRDNGDCGDKRQWWREFVACRADDKHLGYHAGRRVREVLEKQVYDVQCKQRVLEKKLERYAEIEAMLKRLGLNPEWLPNTSSVEDRITEAKAIVPSWMDRMLQHAENEIARLRQALNEFANQPLAVDAAAELSDQ